MKAARCTRETQRSVLAIRAAPESLDADCRRGLIAACLAGVAPSTRQSGKVKAVTFRWGCNKQLRDAICDFAGDSRHDNPWAANLNNRAIARGHDHPHAVRILGRAWAHIIWRCWQDNLSYDRALQALLNTTADRAA